MADGLYYFVSDVHLGLRVGSPEERERRFVRFLRALPPQTKALYLLGDIFDFWYEYRYVVPAGFVRTFGELASLSDRGVELYFFNGNHDIWTGNYFGKELGMKILSEPYHVEICGRNFCLGHGDGLGKVDPGFRFLRALFHSSVARRVFNCLHPRWAFSFAHAWSKHNRLSRKQESLDVTALPVYGFAVREASLCKVDYFVFGHFHFPSVTDVGNGARMFILGEWVNGTGAAVFDGKELRLIDFQE